MILEVMMKKSLMMISAMLLTLVMTGQSSYDYLLRAKALSLSGKHLPAIEILSEAIVNNKESRLYTERADIRLKMRDYAGAVEDYKAANNITWFSGTYGLARAYALGGDAVTAVQYLESVMKSPFRRSEKEIMLDPAFERIESRPEWRSFWKNEWFSVPEKGLSEIEYSVATGRKREASELLAELQKEYQGNKDVIYGSALVNSSAGKYAEAVKILAGLLNVDKNNEKYLRTLAAVQTSAGNHSGASSAYSKLISLEIPDAELLRLRAESYMKTGETNKAKTDIEKYLDLYPESRAGLSFAGKLESASGNNFKALEYFSVNLKFHPNDPDCYVDRANAYLLSRSWDWAVNDYSMALDLDPGNSDAWLNKGIALLNAGKKDDACHNFKRSFSLGNKRATDYISRNCIK